MIVLGIDPGTASTGYGVVAQRSGRLLALDGGVIETPAGLPLERRLATIHARTCELIDEHAPDAVAVEELYFGANARTAFAVGQARGVVLLAAGQRGLPCGSYTPQQVKSAVCGSGRADKAAGPADGRSACSGCPTCRSPTTPPTRSRSRSAT